MPGSKKPERGLPMSSKSAIGLSPINVAWHMGQENSASTTVECALQVQVGMAKKIALRVQNQYHEGDSGVR